MRFFAGASTQSRADSSYFSLKEFKPTSEILGEGKISLAANLHAYVHSVSYKLQALILFITHRHQRDNQVEASYSQLYIANKTVPLVLKMI